ncbi:hypothetical protein ACEPAI_6024 [Sanghuangporus weigelae]
MYRPLSQVIHPSLTTAPNNRQSRADLAMEKQPGHPARAEQATSDPAAKVKRTYGKKREGADASVDITSSVSSRQTRPELSENAEESDTLPSTRFLSSNASDTFGWKERLALIDKQFDDEDGPNQSKHCTVSTRVNKDRSSSPSSSTEDDSSGLRDDALLSASMPPISSQSDPPSPCSQPDTISMKPLPCDSGPPEHAEGMRGDSLYHIAKGDDYSETTGTRISKTPKARNDDHDTQLEGRNTSLATQEGNGSSCETSELNRNEVARKSRARRRGGQPNKIKKLSKKEEKESRKAHARLMADQQVSITKRADQYTVEHLLKSVQKSQHLTGTKPCLISSDPIQDFTSSPMGNVMDTSTEVEPKAGLSGLQSASEDDMPDVHELVKAEEVIQKGEAEVQRRKRLALLKRQALASKTQEANFHSDDDDLEIMSDDRDVGSGRSKVSTELEKRLAGVAGFRVGTSKHVFSEALESSQGDRELKLAAKPTFSDRDAGRHRMHFSHRDLQSAMFCKATKQSMSLTREKEEEWKRRGGKLAGKQRTALESTPLSLGHLAENLALKRRHGGQDSPQDGEERDTPGSEDSSDEEWQPEERGSVSPSNERGIDDDDELEGSVSEDCATVREVAAVTQNTDNHEETDDDDKSLSRPARHARRSTNHLVVSDSEGEETRRQHKAGRILVPDTSFVIDAGQGNELSSEAGPDEENKENNTPLAIDNGDDKENAIPMERSPVGRPYFGNRPHSGFFNLSEGNRHLSLSPMADVDNEGSPSVRRPLQAKRIGDFDDPFILRSPSASTSPKTPKSKGTRSAVSSPASLRPAFDGKAGGFTQLFNDEEGVHMDASSTSVLQPAFRLHSSGDTIKIAKRNDGFVLPEATKKRSKNLMRNGELSLTLDTRLQPALDVTTQVRRRADALFEKEQDFVMDEASTSATSSRSRHELYISENGLLTQTKPEGSTPLVYRSWTPSQNPIVSESEAPGLPPSTTRRLPLSTLSLDGDAISPSQQRLARLIKGKGRADSSDGDMLGSSSYDSASNAFVKMLQAARKQSKTEKRKLGKSHFVEGEAVESDEDELFGFGQPAKGDDDDESDEDSPDAVVENLIDDAGMDVQELAEDKVLEKVKEHFEEDDTALEKYHQAAIEGKFRGKRRGGGVAMEDSESDEDEDEEARILRRRMHKKRRIVGDKLEDLRKDERSKAFYDAYQRDVQHEGDNDFAHLAIDDWKDEDENDRDEEPETVSTTEIHQRLREAARQNRSGEAQQPLRFDPQDVTWTDTLGTSDDEFQVKEIEDRPKKLTARRPIFTRVDVPDFDDALPRKPNKIDEVQAAQLAAWRKEQSGRNLDTGGMRGAITVTGHGSKNPRRGKGSMLKSASSRQQDSQQQTGRRRVAKSASVLASVSDKHSRFGT